MKTVPSLWRRLLAALRRLVAWLTAAGIVAALALIGSATLRDHPQDLPWTPLDLTHPIGLFTGRKLAALERDGVACRGLLARAGIRYAALPARHEGTCGYDDGVRLARGGARQVALVPAGAVTACPVAAALSLWEWNVVQPAAQVGLGSTVAAIDHLGTYSCRRIAASHNWSEHSRADAIDIAGFRLVDGRRISVARDWRGNASKARFLHEVRNGACRLFATTLSPDYNAAHADHLHLDQAPRGALGWRACR